MKRKRRDDYSFDEIIGESFAMQNLLIKLSKIINADSSVLILGETGTGKELIARAIHNNSERKAQPFLPENCNSYNENLLESELFGHEKGAFTGADSRKKGLFELAGKGTILLDEIGDISSSLQAKLLRILQEREFKRVGGSKQIKVRARILMATNKNLKQLLEEGTFRLDLYHRLKGVEITLPPLRERKEDIPLLCDHFIAQYCKRHRLPPKELSSETLAILVNYQWPGNIRELEHEIEKIVIESSEESIVEKSHLSDNIQKQYEEKTGNDQEGLSLRVKENRRELEIEAIVAGLKRTKGNKTRLAKELGISRQGLLNKMKRHKLR